jgi:hypothetical protein
MALLRRHRAGGSDFGRFEANLFGGEHCAGAAWASGPTPPGVDGVAFMSARVRRGFEPAATHQPFGAAKATADVIRTRKRWVCHDGGALGETTLVGSQVEPSGAANSGMERPGAVQQRLNLETGSSRIEPRRHAGRFGRVTCHSQVEVFGPRPDPVSAARAESGACKRDRPSGQAYLGARRVRRAASRSTTSVDGRPNTSVGG